MEAGSNVTAILVFRVRTLTNHANDQPHHLGWIETAPLDFTSADRLAQSLKGADVLYNTYWVRFAHGTINHALAAENTKTLIRAAELAGVRRLVHVSITNPSLHSHLPYFRGKAEVEEAIRDSRLSYAILRPAVLFGLEDILINNIAWLLRKYPVFAVPPGECGVQPIYADDLAALAIEQGAQHDNVVLDAVGPETYRFSDLVRLIRKTVKSHAVILPILPCMLNAAAKALSRSVDDIVLTWDELSGLMSNLLVSKQQPTGATSLRAWLQANADTVGKHYASELARHYTTVSTHVRTGGRDAAVGTPAHRHAWW